MHWLTFLAIWVGLGVLLMVGTFLLFKYVIWPEAPQQPMRLQVAHAHPDRTELRADYVPSEAGFVIWCRLGSQRDEVMMVLDTGSRHFTVVGADCTECPRDSRGSFDWRASSTARLTNGTETLSKVSYATLDADTVSVTDTVELGHLEIPDVPMQVAVSMRGTHSNVMGMARDSSWRHSPYTFVLPQAPFTRGSLVVNDWTYGFDKNLIPLSRRFSYSGTYVVDVMQIYDADTMQPLLTNGPVHVILDTGTSESYISQQVGMEMGLPFVNESTETLDDIPNLLWEFEAPMGRADDAFMWQMPKTDYMVRNSLLSTDTYMRMLSRFVPRKPRSRLFSLTSYSSTLRIGDDILEPIVGNLSRVILLGLSQMRGHSWTFDPVQSQVVVQKL